MRWTLRQTKTSTSSKSMKRKVPNCQIGHHQFRRQRRRSKYQLAMERSQKTSNYLVCIVFLSRLNELVLVRHGTGTNGKYDVAPENPNDHRSMLIIWIWTLKRGKINLYHWTLSMEMYCIILHMVYRLARVHVPNVRRKSIKWCIVKSLLWSLFL